VWLIKERLQQNMQHQKLTLGMLHFGPVSEQSSQVQGQNQNHSQSQSNETLGEHVSMVPEARILRFTIILFHLFNLSISLLKLCIILVFCRRTRSLNAPSPFQQLDHVVAL